MATAAKYFSGVTESYEVSIIAEMCEAIEAGRVSVLSTDKRFRIITPGANGYIYDYTYNFIRWGFAKKARGNEFTAAQHPYCPNQHVSATIANFINTAVEMGYYTRKTSKTFDGGSNIQIIWM